MSVRTISLTGQDLAYWYAKAACKGTPREAAISLANPKTIPPHHIRSERMMRVMVVSAFGPALPDRSQWP